MRAGRHPPGLRILFFTELWERFSFYGLQGLLFLYLTKHFGLDDGRAFEIIGSYTALVFMFPVAGGFAADRWLGARRAIVLGSILVAFGQFSLAFMGESIEALYLSLALIVTGVSFIKANISALVGYLYGPDDPLRDSGFTLFYIGINCGVLLGPIFCGYLGETYGWRYGFGAAGIGMLSGLAVFAAGLARLPDNTPANGSHWVGMSGLLTAGLAASAYFLFQAFSLLGFALAGCAAAIILGVGWFSFRHCSREQQRRHALAFLLMILAMFYWSLFTQATSSIAALAERFVDRTMFGIEIRTSQLLAFNAIFIILLGPVVGWFWRRREQNGRETSPLAKFALAMVLGGLSLGILAIAIQMTPDAEKLPAVWLILFYLLMTSGELCVSPVGLSAMTRLSHPSIQGLMLGAWFLATASAGYLGSVIAKQAVAGAQAYSATFLTLAAMALFVAGVVWVAVLSTRGRSLRKECG